MASLDSPTRFRRPRTRQRVVEEGLALEKGLQFPTRKTKEQQHPDHHSRAQQTSRDRVRAYIDEDFRRDLAIFEKETTKIARGLVNNVRKVARRQLELQTLGQQVEGILSKIRQRGYNESLNMPQAEKGNSGKDLSQAVESSRVTPSQFSKRKPIDRQEILTNSNIYYGSASNAFIDLPTFSCRTHSQHDPSRDPYCTWDEDLAKSAVSTEAYFARTIMITSIFRYRILKVEESLDFNVELGWTSPHPFYINHRSGKLEPNVHLPYPKPDLCVGFHRNALFPKGLDTRWGLIPQHMKPFMVPENIDNSNDLGRAFPFLILEAKGSSAPIGGNKASQQCVIGAAHALYNIWNFMKVTKELEDEFFHHVFVFTASVHGEEYRLHVHRAVRLAVMDGALGDDYPLGYRHMTLKRFKGDDYSQVQVQTMVDYIFDWALSVLLPKVSDAVDHVCKQRAAERSNIRSSPGAVVRAQQHPDDHQDHSTLTASQAPSLSSQQHAATAAIGSRQHNNSQKAAAKGGKKRVSQQPGGTSSAQRSQEQLDLASPPEQQDSSEQVHASKKPKTRKKKQQSTGNSQ